MHEMILIILVFAYSILIRKGHCLRFKNLHLNVIFNEVLIFLIFGNCFRCCSLAVGKSSFVICGTCPS